MTPERLGRTVLDLRSVRNGTSVEKSLRASSCSGSPWDIDEMGDFERYRVTYAYAILPRPL